MFALGMQDEHRYYTWGFGLALRVLPAVTRLTVYRWLQILALGQAGTDPPGKNPWHGNL